MIHDPALLKIINDGIRVLQVVCSVLFTTVVLLALLPQLGVITFHKESSDTLASVLPVIGTVEVLLGIFLKKILFKPKLPVLDETHIRGTLNSYFTSTLIAFVIFESVGIYGLIIFQQSGDINYMYGMGGLAILAMLYSWPKKEEFLSKISQNNQ